MPILGDLGIDWGSELADWRHCGGDYPSLFIYTGSIVYEYLVCQEYTCDQEHPGSCPSMQSDDEQISRLACFPRPLWQVPGFFGALWYPPPNTHTPVQYLALSKHSREIYETMR